MKVELDRDKIGSVNLGSIDPAEIEQLMVDTADKVYEEVASEDATLTLAALGAPYSIGPIDISVALGNLVLLNEINSPFITGDMGEDGAELDTMECFKAIYVLAKGREAVKPIMAIKQRIQSMLFLKPMVEAKPELFQQLMDRVEQIADAHKDFEKAASEFYQENFVGHNFQEVVNSIFLALGDIMKTGNDLPSDGKGEKKKVESTTTAGV